MALETSFSVGASGEVGRGKPTGCDSDQILLPVKAALATIENQFLARSASRAVAMRARVVVAPRRAVSTRNQRRASSAGVTARRTVPCIAGVCHAQILSVETGTL